MSIVYVQKKELVLIEDINICVTRCLSQEAVERRLRKLIYTQDLYLGNLKN